MTRKAVCQILFSFSALVFSWSTSATELNVKPACYLDDEQLFAHVKITYQSTDSSDAISQAKLWSFECYFETMECDAAVLNLDAIENSEPITWVVLNQPKGMRIVSRVGKVFILQWGPYRTLTVDLAQNKVFYRESSYSTEYIGEGTCGLD